MLGHKFQAGFLVYPDQGAGEVVQRVIPSEVVGVEKFGNREADLGREIEIRGYPEEAAAPEGGVGRDFEI